MKKLIFIIAILSCTYLGFILGYNIAAKNTSTYYVMVISYLTVYLQSKVTNEEMLEACVAARNRADLSIKEGKVLQP